MACKELKADDEDWDVWIDFLNRALHGSALPIAELEAYVTAPEDVWHAGAATVNAWIKRRLEEIRQKSVEVPPQRPAPIMVAERAGRMAPVSTRDDPLRAVEEDFDRWREPAVKHLDELLGGDFHSGTNHARARSRLEAVRAYLAGTVADVKERQYDLAYSIERLGRLIEVYGSGADDMPMIVPDVLADLGALHAHLLVGISKLESWDNFRRDSAEDPPITDPDRLTAGAEALANALDQHPDTVDPELPGRLKRITEAAKDRIERTKTLLVGLGRSIGNIASFIAETALSVGGKKVGDEMGKGLSKAAAGSLLTALAPHLLMLADVLPWWLGWLKPVLKSISERLTKS